MIKLTTNQKARKARHFMAVKRLNVRRIARDTEARVMVSGLLRESRRIARDEKRLTPKQVNKLTRAVIILEQI